MKKHSITRDMFHPELRNIGPVIRMIWPVFDDKKFRICNEILDTLEGKSFSGSIYYRQVYVTRRDGSVLRLCVYTPKRRLDNSPGLLWLHGGGYGLGVPEYDIGFIRRFIHASGCVVVAPDYTRSTESPYPAAVNDCYQALTWLKANSEALGVNSAKLFVGGDSAGGGLSAAVTLLARDRGEVSVAFQMPLYPMLDDRPTASSRNNDAPVWNTASNDAAWQLYLGERRGTDKVSKYAAPARETDFRGLPPTLTFVGGIDPFRDETICYVRGLKAAGVDVKFRVYDGCFHAFDVLCGSTTVGMHARRFLMEGFMYAVKNYSCPQP